MRKKAQIEKEVEKKEKAKASETKKKFWSFRKPPLTLTTRKRYLCLAKLSRSQSL